MRQRHTLVQIFTVLVLALLVVLPSAAWADQGQNTTAVNDHRNVTLREEVRHQLVMLPYYSVFDWLEADVRPDGNVILTGQVNQPTLRKDAESQVKRLEGVSQVVNNIELLPLSNNDDEIRTRLYRAIYRFDSPLFKYALQSVGPIHIIVKNGHVTLKGVVASHSDSQLAYMEAQSVFGPFDVKNELQLEEVAAKPVS